MGHWPRDNQAALTAFFGDPGGRGFGANLVKVVPPFAMTYAGKRILVISFHKLAAPALLRALNKIWAYYGRDQRRIDAAGTSVFSGSYVKRYVRGTENTTKKWSNHAYGTAIDIDGPHNGFNTGHGHMALVAVAAFKSEGFSWGGDYHHRTDPMHFEACDRGDPVRSFEQWLAFYKCPPLTFAPTKLATLLDAPEPDEQPKNQPQQGNDSGEADDAPRAGLGDDDAVIEGEIIHETPADAPKTGITQGAQAVGTFSLSGVAYEVWDKISSAPESLLDAAINAAQKPTFWIFLGIAAAATYIWWQRHAAKKGV